MKFQEKETLLKYDTLKPTKNCHVYSCLMIKFIHINPLELFISGMKMLKAISNVQKETVHTVQHSEEKMTY